MKKIIYILILIFVSGTSFAQEEDLGVGIINYGHKKQLLQTSDPLVNDFLNLKDEEIDYDEKEISDEEKEKIMLKQAGYDYKESDYIKAIETGDKVAVLRFLSIDMDPGILKNYTNSTLFYALRSNQTEMFEMLLSKGADINYVNSRSQNLLLMGIELGYDKMVSTLLESKIDLSFVDANGWSAIHYAIDKKDIPVIFKLIDKSPNLLSYKNKFGNTPLLLSLDKALKNHDKELIVLAKMLIQKEKFINITNGVGNTALHLATMLDNYELVKDILEHGANPNVKNAKNWRPIDIALKNENVDIANLLRFYGAKL